MIILMDRDEINIIQIKEDYKKFYGKDIVKNV